LARYAKPSPDYRQTKILADAEGIADLVYIQAQAEAGYATGAAFPVVEVSTYEDCYGERFVTCGGNYPC